jgi:tRNA-dihydrouridine synthase
MAGITNSNYRLLARKFGCALAFTEMVSSNGLVRDAVKNKALFGFFSVGPPLGVQIFGADPAVMAELPGLWKIRVRT